MRIYFAFCIFLFSFFLSTGQSIHIFGKVSDRNTGEALVGVNILYGENKGTISLSDGTFNINVFHKPKQIEFRYIGYKVVIKEIKSENKEIELNISLIQKTEMIDEVVVSASRFKQNRKDISVSMEVINQNFILNNFDLSYLFYL